MILARCVKLRQAGRSMQACRAIRVATLLSISVTIILVIIIMRAILSALCSAGVDISSTILRKDAGRRTDCTREEASSLSYHQRLVRTETTQRMSELQLLPASLLRM